MIARRAKSDCLLTDARSLGSQALSAKACGDNRSASRVLLGRREFLRFTTLATGVLALGGLSGCGGFSSGPKVTVSDMAGRSVEVPQTITRTFCTNPIGTVNLYALAPDMIAGWNFLPAGDARKYIEEEYLSLPSLGVWMGSGAVPNPEAIASVKPDVLLCFWTADEAGKQMADEIEEETHIPTLVVDYSIEATPSMFRFVGSILGKEERAEQLASYCENRLEAIRSIAASIPASERKSVYLAQGIEGLTTDPRGSMHVTDALALINTENVVDMPGTEGQGMGMPSVNLEQIITWNPDAVLVSEYSMSDAESSDIYSGICADSRWAKVPAVAAGQVYRIPNAPFSWFGRPPSAMRILGCQWLLRVLYPAYSSSLDIVQETRDFYATFLRYASLTDDQLHALLDAAGVTW